MPRSNHGARARLRRLISPGRRPTDRREDKRPLSRSKSSVHAGQCARVAGGMHQERLPGRLAGRAWKREAMIESQTIPAVGREGAGRLDASRKPCFETNFWRAGATL